MRILTIFLSLVLLGQGSALAKTKSGGKFQFWQIWFKKWLVIMQKSHQSLAQMLMRISTCQRQVMRSQSQADIVFVNGLGFETWVADLISNSGTNATIVTVSDKVTPLLVDDPHAWNNIDNGITICPSDCRWFE